MRLSLVKVTQPTLSCRVTLFILLTVILFLHISRWAGNRGREASTVSCCNCFSLGWSVSTFINAMMCPMIICLNSPFFFVLLLQFERSHAASGWTERSVCWIVPSCGWELPLRGTWGNWRTRSPTEERPDPCHPDSGTHEVSCSGNLHQLKFFSMSFQPFFPFMSSDLCCLLKKKTNLHTRLEYSTDSSFLCRNDTGHRCKGEGATDKPDFKVYQLSARPPPYKLYQMFWS